VKENNETFAFEAGFISSCIGVAVGGYEACDQTLLVRWENQGF